ncbi:uncharacterized protein BO88DRAFT_352081, partial [Aspergillus vadensis CBS 113365]
PSIYEVSVHPYAMQVAVLIPTEQYLSTYQASYPHKASPTHEYHVHQSQCGTPVLVQDQVPIVMHPIIVASTVDIQRAQQYCILLIQLQRRHNYVYHRYIPQGF